MVSEYTAMWRDEIVVRAMAQADEEPCGPSNNQWLKRTELLERAVAEYRASLAADEAGL